MKKEMETKLIDFEGGKILGFRTEDGQVWMGVKKTCIDIGLSEKQADRQIANTQEDLVLKSKSLKFEVVQKEGNRQVKREIIALNEEVITLWLAKIALTPKMQEKNPETVDKLIKYQLKASKVLHNAFMATEEQKQEFYSEMGLQGEIVELKDTINNLEGKIDTMDGTMGILINSATINAHQAKQLNKLVRERISTILGGAHSINYKEKSRMYFKNCWLNLCDQFNVSEYRDLNPLNFSNAVTFVNDWSMM